MMGVHVVHAHRGARCLLWRLHSWLSAGNLYRVPSPSLPSGVRVARDSLVDWGCRAQEASPSLSLPSSPLSPAAAEPEGSLPDPGPGAPGALQQQTPKVGVSPRGRVAGGAWAWTLTAPLPWQELRVSPEQPGEDLPPGLVQGAPAWWGGGAPPSGTGTMTRERKAPQVRG